MKNLTLAALGSLSLAFAGPTLAQSFTYDVTWEPVDSVGGMIGPDGPQGGGGVVEGTYTTAYSDGTSSSGTVKCVGLQQPDGGIFDIHMSCSINDVNGKSSSVYGCNYLGEAGPDTALGCVGGLQGKDGAVAGRNGSLTMHWYSDTKSTGTGQWYAAE